MILYGRVGTWSVRTANMKKGAPGDTTLWTACSQSIMQHVVLPWRADGNELRIGIQ